LKNRGGGVEGQEEWVGVPLGGIESSIGLSPLELSILLEESTSIVAGFTSTHGGDKE